MLARRTNIRFCRWILLLLLSIAATGTGTDSRPELFRFRQHLWGRYTRGGSYNTQQNHPPGLAEVPPSLDDHDTGSTSTTSYSQSPTTESSSITANTNETNHTTSISNNNNNNNTTIPEWQRAFPPPLCYKRDRIFQRIRIPYQNQMADIYLLGTAHVSNDSSADVKLLLKHLAPDVIFVELCDQRTSLMEDPPAVLQNMTHRQHNDDNNNNNSTALKKAPSFWDKVQEVQLASNNSKVQCMATVLLTSTQEEYAESLGVELGGEFKAAYQYWRSFPAVASTQKQPPPQRRRPHLILGDRPLAITLARCWESLSWFGKCKVLVGLMVSSLFLKPKPEELREWIRKILEDEEADLLTKSLEDLRKHFPSLERVIIQERDAYMACKLYQLCRGMLVSAVATATTASNTNHDDDHNRKPIVIAALVGAGHLPGICAWLTTKTHPQGPEEILSNLVATKKFRDHDMSHFIYDVTELQDLPDGSSAS